MIARRACCVTGKRSPASAARITPSVVKAVYVQRHEVVWAVRKIVTALKTSNVMFSEASVSTVRTVHCIARHVMIKHRVQGECAVLVSVETHHAIDA